MHNYRTRSGYRRYIRRKRLLFSVVILAIAGIVTAASIHRAGRSAAAVRGERRELLRLWEAGNLDEVYNLSQAALVSRQMDYFLLTMHGFSAYQLGISQINSLNAAKYFEDCVWALRKAALLKEGASDGRLYYVLGKAYNYKGESYADLSIKYLEKARGLSFRAADIPEYLGLAYAEIGDYRSSVAAFAEALDPRAALDPGLTGTHNQGERNRALSGPLLLAIARSYFALGELDQAQAYLRHCIDVSPDSRTRLAARLLLAEVLRKANDINGARKQLLDIIEETGENAEARYQLGELYVLQGDTVRARAEWRLARQADPAHVGARARLSM
ncbi:MAG: tetratricopeptide repeat protein [Treponema sp.]|nr:tetratricopeptide repeat protein [Treponema sp.]